MIKAGYGIYPDTSVYQNIVLQHGAAGSALNELERAEQRRVPADAGQRISTRALPSLATPSASIPTSASAMCRPGILPVQRDLPFALQMTATYRGIKGTHGPQEILPNSYPLGEANPCPELARRDLHTKPRTATRFASAGQMQLRRRLRSGFAASLTYTYSKSIDDDAYLGGQGHTTGKQQARTQSANLSSPSAAVAQNWLDPRAERSLSNFDQRQLLNVQAQYTSGQGLEGGTLLGGWRGRALKEWTVLGTLSLRHGTAGDAALSGRCSGHGIPTSSGPI